MWNKFPELYYFIQVSESNYIHICTEALTRGLCCRPKNKILQIYTNYEYEANADVIPTTYIRSALNTSDSIWNEVTIQPPLPQCH